MDSRIPVCGLQDNPTNQRVIFQCPGCGYGHFVQVKLKNLTQGALWSWNGSLDRPTFSPSILVTGVDEETGSPKVCHSFVTDGQIQFLHDCFHALAGKTVPLAPF